MAAKILMPALSPTMTDGLIIKWDKGEGDKVQSGDILLEVETDKATMEVEAVDEGILGKIFFHQGKVSVNTLIGLIVEEGEDLEQVLNTFKEAAIQDQPKSHPEEKIVLESCAIKKPLPQPDQLKRIIASPLAKKIAKENNVDLSKVKGSGPRGRIIRVDVLSYQKPMIQEPSNESYAKDLSSMRKIIAKRLVESKQTIPHFYLSRDICLDPIMSLRAQVNAFDQVQTTLNDWFLKACALSLSRVPNVNVSLEETKIRYYQSVDLGFAVSLDGGLITPIIQCAEKKSILSISKEAKDLIQRARLGKLSVGEYQGGSFCVSNLGMYGVTSFQAIINPPQACILAIGAGEKRSVVVNDTVIIQTTVTVNLSVDHRIIDGSDAAKFLTELKNCIENPLQMMMF